MDRVEIDICIWLSFVFLLIIEVDCYFFLFPSLSLSFFNSFFFNFFVSSYAPLSLIILSNSQRKNRREGEQSHADDSRWTSLPLLTQTTQLDHRQQNHQANSWSSILLDASSTCEEFEVQASACVSVGNCCSIQLVGSNVFSYLVQQQSCWPFNNEVIFIWKFLIFVGYQFCFFYIYIYIFICIYICIINYL